MRKFLIIAVLAMLAVPAMAQMQVNIAPESFAYLPWATSDTTDTIKITVPPIVGMRAVVLGGRVGNADSSAHHAYFMTHNKRTTLKYAMLASASVAVLSDTTPDAAGSAPAAGDIFVIQKNNGTYQTVTCSVYTAGDSITFKGGEVSTIASKAGLYVWAMGAPGDANSQVMPIPALASTSFPSSTIVGGFSGPILYRSSNIPNTGTAGAHKPDTVRFISVGYVPK